MTSLSSGNRNPTEMPLSFSLCTHFPINFLKVRQYPEPPWVFQEVLRRAALALEGEPGAGHRLCSRSPSLHECSHWPMHCCLHPRVLCVLGLRSCRRSCPGALWAPAQVIKFPSFQAWLQRVVEPRGKCKGGWGGWG